MTSSEIKEKLIAEKAVRDRERIAAEAAITQVVTDYRARRLKCQEVHKIKGFTVKENSS